MIVIDQEFQSLIPPLSDDEYKGLEKSILAEGLREPIITWNGTIIDGHNRYAICDEHGIPFTQVEHEFPSRDAAKIWIIENQFGRRNLSKYDRSVLALQLEPLYAAEAKRRALDGNSRGGKSSQKSDATSDGSEEGGKSYHLRTDEQLAKLAGTSRDTIRKVKTIEQAAEAGNPVAVQVRDELRSGEKKSIHGAYVAVVGKPKPRKPEDTVTEDGRRICAMCGEPINEGEANPARPTVHKKCEQEYQRDWVREKRTADKTGTTDDGRRICSICGEPINAGDAYDYKPHVHKSCLNKRASEQRYANPDKSLLDNVPTYTAASLLAELTASAEAMRGAFSESIAINESMGVRLSRRQKRLLKGAVLKVFKTIQKIEEEVTNE